MICIGVFQLWTGPALDTITINAFFKAKLIFCGKNKLFP